MIARLKPCVLVMAALLMIAGGPTSAKDSAPTFSQYPAEQQWNGKHPTVLERTGFSKQFRSRMREAAVAPPNLAGHYVGVTFGCGTSCLMGGVVDLNSGKVIEYPQTTCCYEGDEKRVQFQQDSHLVIFRGVANEEGPKVTNYYVLLDGKFQLIHQEGLKEPVGNSSSLPDETNSATFGSYRCTGDCSGHKAGYAWAEQGGITSASDCRGKSKSFIEGCLAYVEEQ